MTLPPGVYGVIAKTFWATRTEVSLGGNWKPPPSPSGFDAHIAVRELYPTDWSFLVEYDAALDDPLPSTRSGDLPGLLNVGITRSLGDNLQLKFAVRDIFGHRPGNGINRILEVAMEQHF